METAIIILIISLIILFILFVVGAVLIVRYIERTYSRDERAESILSSAAPYADEYFGGVKIIKNYKTTHVMRRPARDNSVKPTGYNISGGKYMPFYGEPHEFVHSGEVDTILF